MDAIYDIQYKVNEILNKPYYMDAINQLIDIAKVLADAIGNKDIDITVSPNLDYIAIGDERLNFNYKYRSYFLDCTVPGFLLRHGYTLKDKVI